MWIRLWLEFVSLILLATLSSSWCQYTLNHAQWLFLPSCWYMELRVRAGRTCIGLRCWVTCTGTSRLLSCVRTNSSSARRDTEILKAKQDSNIAFLKENVQTMKLLHLIFWNDFPFISLRWFRCIALCIPIVQNFWVISTHTRARVHTKRKRFQTKLESEINACFLLNEHGDPHFLVHEFTLHKVIYNISRFELKFKILLKYTLILML